MDNPKLKIPHIFLGETPIAFANPTDGIRIASCVDCGDVELSPRMFQMDVSIDIPSISDDVFRTLWEDERRMDIVVTDNDGRELHIPDVQVVRRLRVTGRIPRSMKKLLKKSYGAEWLHYHPNTETEVILSKKQY